MPEMDLRQEVMARLSEPETRRKIADALILEATGGAPDPKSGVPKGGATVIRAFELLREIALERPPIVAAETDFSRYTDIELVATLTRLEAEEGVRPDGAAAESRPQGIADRGERARSPPRAADWERNPSGDGQRERKPSGDAEAETGGGYG